MQVNFYTRDDALMCDMICDKGEAMPSMRELQNHASDIRRGIVGVHSEITSTPRGRAIKFISSRPIPPAAMRTLKSGVIEAFPRAKQPPRKSKPQQPVKMTGGAAARRNG